MNKSAKPKKQITAKYRSTTHYILASLIPYTEANLKLAFKPTAFFNDLEKLDRYKASTLANSYYGAIKKGYIELDATNSPILTEAGLSRLKRYEPKILNGAANILVIFDIPEDQRYLRQKLRTLLRELRLEPVQQSVWSSQYDVLEYLVPAIKREHLDAYVQVYESARIV